MPRIVHFEIYADDVGRASKFYTDLFGWEINKWDGPPQMDYRLVVTGREGPGIDGGITGWRSRQNRPPAFRGHGVPGTGPARPPCWPPLTFGMHRLEGVFLMREGLGYRPRRPGELAGVNYVDVESIDDYLGRVQNAGLAPHITI